MTTSLLTTMLTGLIGIFKQVTQTKIRSIAFVYLVAMVPFMTLSINLLFVEYYDIAYLILAISVIVLRFACSKSINMEDNPTTTRNIIIISIIGIGISFLLFLTLNEKEISSNEIIINSKMPVFFIIYFVLLIISCIYCYKIVKYYLPENSFECLLIYQIKQEGSMEIEIKVNRIFKRIFTIISLKNKEKKFCTYKIGYYYKLDGAIWYNVHLDVPINENEIYNEILQMSDIVCKSTLNNDDLCTMGLTSLSIHKINECFNDNDVGILNKDKIFFFNTFIKQEDVSNPILIPKQTDDTTSDTTHASGIPSAHEQNDSKLKELMAKITDKIKLKYIFGPSIFVIFVIIFFIMYKNNSVIIHEKIDKFIIMKPIIEAFANSNDFMQNSFITPTLSPTLTQSPSPSPFPKPTLSITLPPSPTPMPTSTPTPTPLPKQPFEYSYFEICDWNNNGLTNDTLIKKINEINIDIDKIKYLNITNNIKLTDISPITKFINLEKLEIGGESDNKSNIYNLDPLENLTNLKCLYIDLMDTVDAVDISPLSSMVSLEELKLYIRGIETLDSIKDMIKINKLLLRAYNVTDLSPLINLINLESLEISIGDVINIEPILYLSINGKLTEIYIGQGFTKDQKDILRDKFKDGYHEF